MSFDGNKMTPEQMDKKISSILMDMDCSSQIAEDIKYEYEYNSGFVERTWSV